MHHLKVLSLICVLSVAVKSQTIAQYPPVIKSRGNEIVTLYCQMHDMVPFCYTIAWMKLHPKSGTLELYNDLEMVVDNEKHSCRADIHRATTDNSGTYYCAVVYKEKLFIGNGTTVVVESQGSPSVEIALTVRHRPNSSAVLTCVVTAIHPSQARVFWSLGEGREENGHTESVWTNGSGPVTVFTRNQVVVSLTESGLEETYTCVVESEGTIFNRSLTLSDPEDICFASAHLSRVLGITSALLLQMMMVAMAQHFRKIKTLAKER